MKNYEKPIAEAVSLTIDEGLMSSAGGDIGTGVSVAVGDSSR